MERKFKYRYGTAKCLNDVLVSKILFKKGNKYNYSTNGEYYYLAKDLYTSRLKEFDKDSFNKYFKIQREYGGNKKN